MPLSIQPMNEVSARSLVNWRYDAPYDFYNINTDEIEKEVEYFTDPQNAYYAIMNETGELIGFCSFGLDGQVPGGDYSQEALDIGMGIRPDLTGQGNGVQTSEVVLDFASRRFDPDRFRVTVAAFNKRAQRVWQKLNFRAAHSFSREQDGEPFFILLRGKK